MHKFSRMHDILNSVMNNCFDTAYIISQGKDRALVCLSLSIGSILPSMLNLSISFISFWTVLYCFIQLCISFITIDYQLIFQASIPVDVFFFHQNKRILNYFDYNHFYITPKNSFIIKVNSNFLELQTLTDFACNCCTFAPSYK